MAKIKQLEIKDTAIAMERIANYYRCSRLYTYLSNMSDAYQWYIDEYSHDTECIIAQGNSYQYKNNYLIAVDLELFSKEHPDEFKHYFEDAVPDIFKTVSRERGKALFICAFGPSKDFMDSNSYTLLNMFAKLKSDYIILTDCPSGPDINRLSMYTKARPIIIGGREAWRWAK